MAIQSKRQGHYFDFVVPVAAFNDDHHDLMRELASLRLLKTKQEEHQDDSPYPEYTFGDPPARSHSCSNHTRKEDVVVKDQCVAQPISTEPSAHSETDLSFLCLGDDTLQDLSQLDEYHLGLLQTAGSNPKAFKPSFRRNGVILQQGDRPKASKSDAPKIRPAVRPKPKPRPRNLVLSQHRHIPHTDYQRESFWLYEEESVTPRVTLTRYDLRSDEKEIYGWKHGAANKR